MTKLTFEGDIEEHIKLYFILDDDGAVRISDGRGNQSIFPDDGNDDNIKIDIDGKKYDLKILFGTTETTIRLIEIKGSSLNSTEVNSSPDEVQMSRIDEAADRSMSTPQTQEENTTVEAKLINSIDRIESVNIDRQQELINLQLEINATLDNQLRSSTILHDGMERAIDQIQDKRITWLELGPEVRASDIMVEMLWTALPLGIGMIGKLVPKPLISKRISEMSFENILKRQKISSIKPNQIIDTKTADWAALSKIIEKTRNAKLALSNSRLIKGNSSLHYRNYDKALKAEDKAWKIVIDKANKEKNSVVKSVSKKRKAILGSSTDTNDRDLNKKVKEVLSNNFSGIAVSGLKKKVNAKGSKLKQGNSAIAVLRSQVQKHLREEEYRTRSIAAHVDALVKFGLNNERKMLDVYIELSAVSVSLALPPINVEEYDEFVDMIQHETEKILWSVILASKIKKASYDTDGHTYSIFQDTNFKGLDDRVIIYLISRFAYYVPLNYKWFDYETWGQDDRLIKEKSIEFAKVLLEVKNNFDTHCADMLSFLETKSSKVQNSNDGPKEKKNTNNQDQSSLNSVLDVHGTNIPGIWEEITPLQFRSEYLTPKPNPPKPVPNI